MVIIDASSNMMTGSQLRKEKEEFIKLYQLELAMRKEKESLGNYASGVVMSKNYREEISEEKKKALLEEIEKEKKSRTVTTDWQPNAIL